MNAVIELKSITTKFGEQYVHRDISFNVEAGSIVAVIGGSGSGKSTLLKEIVGLLRPTAGKVTLFGTDVWNAAAEAVRKLHGRCGVLFQNGALFSGLTVGENIAVPLVEQAKVPEYLIKELVQLRLALAGLAADVSQKMPSELSGGMVKRAALARALALEPELLFLDEPTSGLDPINARAFDKLILTLSKSLGITVFMVTHDLDTIMSVPDRVIILGEGQILADGPVEKAAQVDHPWIRDYFSSRL